MIEKVTLDHFTIAKMSLEDFQEVLTISTSFPLVPWTQRMFLEEMANPLSHCFVAKLERNHGASVIGFICFRNVEDESELLHLCVHPHHRQKGIGKRLMQFYIDFCIQRGIHSFYLEVDPSNQPALHLYKGFSYNLLKVRKNFFQGNQEGWVMVKKTLKNSWHGNSMEGF